MQKRGILAKVKEREGCNHRNTLKYFEDYNLKRDAACPAIAFSDGGKLAKRAVYGWTLSNFSSASVASHDVFLGKEFFSQNAGIPTVRQRETAFAGLNFETPSFERSPSHHL
jgi:hypothetical protein